MLIYIFGIQIRKSLKTEPKNIILKESGITSTKRNPKIIASLTTFPERINTVAKTIKTILNNASPQTAFNTFLATNPQAQEAQQLIMQYGNGDPKKAFYELAKVRGIDPSRILSELGIG